MSGMAEFLGKFVGNAGGGFIESTANAIDKFVTTDKERMELQIVLEKVLQARDSEIEGTIRAEAEAKAQIIVAELNQSDKYTKRARPTVIYGGLVVIAWNYCLVPFIPEPWSKRWPAPGVTNRSTRKRFMICSRAIPANRVVELRVCLKAAEKAAINKLPNRAND